MSRPAMVRLGVLQAVAASLASQDAASLGDPVLEIRREPWDFDAPAAGDFGVRPLPREGFRFSSPIVSASSSPKSAAVLKRRAKNKAARAARKKSRQ